jgi:hypothetical protein
VADLRRRGPGTDEYAWRPIERKALAQLARQELRLVESALPQARAVKRDRDHPLSAQALDNQPLGHQQRERLGQASPAVILEPLQSNFSEAFVRDC